MEIVNNTMREALLAQSRGDVASAHSLLESALRSIPIEDADGRARLIAFDADLYADAKAFNRAIDLYHAALALCGTDAYRTYSIELSIGAILERTGETAKAKQWYAKAIGTSLLDETISAGSALLRLVTLADGQLTDEERTASEAAVRHSWQLLRLAGEADTSDLIRAAKHLVEAANARE